ncbi:putative peptidase A1 family protein [Teratosphaeria destructans]|uniref:Peptidase A1 family protein n=1 Tax=Teratosphaeria destructans TaxID=418781 RepID=A0A9W7SSV6_9PEZI|nr:putative peptidase A1 family protein [Teratosphaeria destructans]
MHSVSAALGTAAVLLTAALAAPTKQLGKRGVFSVPVKARASIRRPPRQELSRTYAKYGWTVVVVDPEPDSSPFEPFGTGDDGSSSSAAGDVPWPSSAAAPLPTFTTSASVASATAGTYGNSTSGTTSHVGTGTAADQASATASATSGAETGRVSAIPEENDSEYLESVQIGSDGQTLNLDFDTGSADLWVFSSDLSTSEATGHSSFNPSKSSSWQAYSGASWQISYGDGSGASGAVGYDKVAIGGATATKQAVEIATQVSSTFASDTNSDGLVGLAFSSINTVEPEAQKTFFYNVKDQLAEYVFTANLKDSSAGTYTFGTIDSSQYTGDIHYVDIDNSDGFWQWSPTAYSVDGESSECPTCSPAIADTGTSLILVDDDIVEAYYKQVSNAEYSNTQGGYTYPCSASLPSFGVQVGDWTATVDGSDLTYATIDDSTCFGGIQSNEGEGVSIYGDMFLKQFFAVFDGEKNRLGFAEQA